MGTYNYQPEIIATVYRLKDNLCPFCNSIIEKLPNSSHAEDCFHYKCVVCNPNVVIAIAGACLLKLERLESNQLLLNQLRMRIKNSTDELVSISDSDFMC